MTTFYSIVSNEIQLHLFAKVIIHQIFRDIHLSSSIADGYFPDRQNCRIYHICTSGVDTAAVCGEGTAWDPVTKNCNWENTVQCKKGLRRWDQITDIRGGKIID